MLFTRAPPPPNDQDDAEAGCKLMDAFAIFIQLCLAAAAFSTLIIKRHREHPQRPVRIWYFSSWTLQQQQQPYSLLRKGVLTSVNNCLVALSSIRSMW